MRECYKQKRSSRNYTTGEAPQMPTTQKSPTKPACSAALRHPGAIPTAIGCIHKKQPTPSHHGSKEKKRGKGACMSKQLPHHSVLARHPLATCKNGWPAGPPSQLSQPFRGKPKSARQTDILRYSTPGAGGPDLPSGKYCAKKVQAGSKAAPADKTQQ